MSNPRPIALVISDIDGTLITSNHELTEATKATAVQLREHDITFSLASSRPPRAILPLAEALKMDGPFAAFNGALIVSGSGEVLSSSVISPNTIAKARSIADDYGLAVWVYDDHDWWVPARDSFVEREEHTSGFSPRIDGYDERASREANKLTVVGNPERVARAEVRVLT